MAFRSECKNIHQSTLQKFHNCVFLLVNCAVVFSYRKKKQGWGKVRRAVRREGVLCIVLQKTKSFFTSKTD